MAEVYTYEDKVIKLFYPGVNPSIVEHEFNIINKIDTSTIKTPKVYEIRNIDDRQGIVMDRVDGSSLVSILPKKFRKVSDFGIKFAQLQYSIHQQQSEQFSSYRASLADRISRVEIPEEIKAYTLEHLENLPNGTALCHADFHPDNVLVEDDNLVAIDWMDAHQGHPLFDVARTTYLLLHASPPSNFIMRFIIGRFRSKFYKAYITEYTRLSGHTEAEIDRFILPILVARILKGIKEEEDTLKTLIASYLPPELQDVVPA